MSESLISQPGRKRRPRVVQVINDLGRGGAETLLVGLLPDLMRHFDVLLVTLRGSSEFSDEELAGVPREILGFDRVRKLPGAALALRRLLKKFQPDLVVSHLYWSTILARLATPKSVPFISNLHMPMSMGAFTPDFTGKVLKILERATYSRREAVIGVSHDVLKDYDSIIGLKGSSYVLHNYVNDAFFNIRSNTTFGVGKQLRLVAVGNPRPQKNYELLIEAFSLLQSGAANCDIYGDSPFRKTLEARVAELHLPIIFKGKAAHMSRRLPDYDAYIMCSKYEGFGIAAAEAMAAGLPLLLSDLDVLREVSGGNAVFFNPGDPADLAQKICEFREGKYPARDLSERGRKLAQEQYSREVYLEKLLRIYMENLS
ncbi:MAG TPA: glycosyltransferase [Chitinophagaceae bacterium]|nr:glycosyltransferase [Chitinophagaceae bacterium]